MTQPLRAAIVEAKTNMPQLNKGDTFADGQQVTGVRLNNLVDGATILPGIITDQTNITANTIASGDSILLYDLSATALREANVSDVLGSNLPITTSAVTAGANNDILITPNDGVIVTGQTYTSANGLTVTVTSTAHLLTVGQVILVTAAGTGYNGTFRVATVLTNSFTYVMTTAATAGSGTLSYTKKAMVNNPANESIAGTLYVDGTLAVAGTSTFTGNATFTAGVGGTSAIKIATGTTAERPASPVAGQLRFNTTSGALEVYSGTGWINGVTSGSANFDGTVNITGAIQYNGKPVYGVYEWYDAYNFVASGTHVGYVGQKLETTAANHTKGPNERWIIGVFVAFFNYDTSYRLIIKGSDNVVYYTGDYVHSLVGVGGYDSRSASVTLTSQEFSNLKFYAFVEQQGNPPYSFADNAGAGNPLAMYNKIAIEKWITA